MFCFHEPILQKEMFSCVSSLFLRNSLCGTGCGLTAANGICMEAASPTNNSTEGLQPSSFLIPLGRSSHPLFLPLASLPPRPSRALGILQVATFAGSHPYIPFFTCALSYRNFIDSQGLKDGLYRQFQNSHL